MRATVTVLNLLAFFLIVYGLRSVFRQVNDDARWARRSLDVARGIPPQDYEANAKWLAMETEQRLLIEYGAQAEKLSEGILKRQRGAKVASIGALLVLVAAVLPLWWS